MSKITVRCERITHSREGGVVQFNAAGIPGENEKFNNNDPRGSLVLDNLTFEAASSFVIGRKYILDVSEVPPGTPPVNKITPTCSDPDCDKQATYWVGKDGADASGTETYACDEHVEALTGDDEVSVYLAPQDKSAE